MYGISIGVGFKKPRKVNDRRYHDDNSRILQSTGKPTSRGTAEGVVEQNRGRGGRGKDYSHNQFDTLNILFSSSRGCSHHEFFSFLRLVYIGHV